MALLAICEYPDPVLGKVAVAVPAVSDTTRRIITDLVETMYAAPGIGLAAPQVGVLERIVVLDIDPENPGKQLFKLVNPAVTRAEGEVIWEEGCLSVVDFTAEVKRAARVEVVAVDEKEKEVKIAAEGLLAVVLQHEIDHLDGKLFIDRISRLKRNLYTRKLKKWTRTGKARSEPARLMI